MEESEVDSGQPTSWTLVQNQEASGEQMDGPLLVAMQPGVDVPAVEAVEVVVVTENGEEVTDSDIQTVVDANTGEIVAIGAIEEVEEERLLEDTAEYSPGDNKGGGAAHHHHRPLGDSSTDSGSDDDSSGSADSDDDSNRKKPKQRDFAYRLQWKNKDMQEAMKYVGEKKMTIRGAAKKFGVPYSTLKDRVHGRVKHGTKPGVKTALSPEEEEDLVKYIKDMESAGFQLRCIDVRDRAGEILQLNHGHNSPYKDGSPGHNWLAGFLKRHPGLEFKKAMNRSVIPGLQKQRAMCRRFFEVTTQTYRKHRLTHKAERVYAVAEMKISLFLDATILVCAAADGTLIPPFVIFQGQRLKLTSAREAYPEAFFTCSYNGRVNDVVLLWWFRDHFLKKIPSSGHRPCVLFLSRAVGDITFQLSQLAREERVHIISIPPGIGHLLQPLDENIARTLENAILKKARKWELENAATPFSQKVLAQILQKVWRKGIGMNEIVERFSTNGVFPVNPNAISSERIATASQALKEQQKSPSPLLGSNNSQFSGLSLLSALSSHEYASLDLHGASDSPSKESPLVDQDDYMSSEERTPKSRYGKRKRSDRHAEKERHKQRVSQEIEKIIEEAQSRTLSGSVSAEQSDNAMLASLIEEATKEVMAEPQREAEEGPTIRSELLGAKENFDQINRAIESIGGSVGSQSTHDQTAQLIRHVISTNSQSETVESIELETVDDEHMGETKIYDQDGNEVGVTEEGEVITEEGEVITEEVITHQLDTAEEIIYKEEGVDPAEMVEEEEEEEEEEARIKEEMVEEEVVQEDFIEQEVFTTEADMEVPQDNQIEEGEVCMDKPDVIEVFEEPTQLSDEPMYVTVSDAGPVDSSSYTGDDSLLYTGPEVEQHLEYINQCGQTVQLLQPSISQPQELHILQQPSLQFVQAGSSSQPRIIKLVQGVNSLPLDLAQIQELIRLSSQQQQQQQLITMPEDNVVMLSDDCVQEVILE